MITGRYMIVQAKRFNFKPEPTERDPNPNYIKLAKITYLDEPDPRNRDLAGKEILTVNADYDLFDNLPKVPGTYTLEFTMRADAKTKKPTLYLKAVHPAGTIPTEGEQQQ